MCDCSKDPQDPKRVGSQGGVRYPENVPGPFWTSDCCCDCDCCRMTAPNNFTRSIEFGYSYVSKQPENELELQLCREALEGCPVEAINEDR